MIGKLTRRHEETPAVHNPEFTTNNHLRRSSVDNELNGHFLNSINGTCSTSTSSYTTARVIV